MCFIIWYIVGISDMALVYNSEPKLLSLPKIHSISILFCRSDWVWCFSFCCCFCFCFAQPLRNCLSGPAINNSVRQREEQRGGRSEGGSGGVGSALRVCRHMSVCVCTCVYAFTRMWCYKSLILPAPSGHISCNRPSVKARQLTIRGGGGGGGVWGVMGWGLYQRLSIIHNHKPHTLTGLRAGISA